MPELRLEPGGTGFYTVSVSGKSSCSSLPHVPASSPGSRLPLRQSPTGQLLLLLAGSPHGEAAQPPERPGVRPLGRGVCVLLSG